MYSGALINDLFVVVERVFNNARPPQLLHAGSRTLNPEPPASICHCTRESSESEKFPQSLGLRPADWNLGLLLVIHAQLVRALEPRNNFADALDIYQIAAVRPPETIP